MRWVWFSIIAAVFFGAAWSAKDAGWVVVSSVLGLVMIVFFVAALAEFLTRYGEIHSVIYQRNQQARYTTSVVMIAEAIRSLHPESAKLLNRFTARAVWDVKIDMDKRERDVMLRGTNIHLGFVEFVLNNSANGKLYPRWKFSEGSFEWDPYKQVTDRAQHDEFELWLSSRLIVVRAYDNAPAVILPPWTPELIKEAIGIVDQLEFYTPRSKAVVNPLPGQNSAPAARVEKIHEERPLTDEDMETIHALEIEREQLSVRDYMKKLGRTVQ